MNSNLASASHPTVLRQRGLRAKFSDELEHGRERRVMGYATKVHAIAMSNAPNALTACLRLLAYHDPRWRIRAAQDDGPPAAGKPQSRGGDMTKFAKVVNVGNGTQG